MERLTKSKGGKFGGFINPDGRERNYLPPDKIGVLLDRLADLEDKLESGQLVELPCVRTLTDSKSILYRVFFMNYTYERSGMIDFNSYRSKELAEAKLKELQEKN